MPIADLAALIRSSEDVVLSDAFEDPTIVAAAATAHRHAFAAGDLEELTRLVHAHRTARRIIVAARTCEGLDPLCADAGVLLLPLDPG